MMVKIGVDDIILACDAVFCAIADAVFVESDHPRGPDGKFGNGAGSGKHKDLKPSEVFEKLNEHYGDREKMRQVAKDIIADRPDLERLVRSEYSDAGYSASDLGQNATSFKKEKEKEKEELSSDNLSRENLSREGLRNLLKEEVENDDNYGLSFGLRIIDGHRVSVGEELRESSHWIDGKKGDDKLGGTSVLDVTPESFDRACRLAGSYLGDQIVLVVGERVGSGEDDGEGVLVNPRVIGEAKFTWTPSKNPIIGGS
jgi:hypothetical protein